MNIKLFNAALAFGWLLLVSGIAMWSVPAALAFGGGLVIVITLLLAFRVGVGGVRPGQQGKG
jgi:hypothetical protein